MGGVGEAAGQIGGCVGCCVEGMDSCNESMNFIIKTFSCFASPLAFPCVYLFDPEDEDNVGQPWDVGMEKAVCYQPIICCCAMILPCCAQWWVRRNVLGNDMSRYKCCQGYLDGPYCCAVCSPRLPFTWRAGNYGEDSCPDCCLCLEASCCPYMAFSVSRLVLREERQLRLDPTEVRVDKCLDCFGGAAVSLFCTGCCLQCCGCLLACNGQDEAGESMMRLGETFNHMSGQIIQGMRYVIWIAMGCMSSQIMHELSLQDKGIKANLEEQQPLKQMQM